MDHVDLVDYVSYVTSYEWVACFPKWNDYTCDVWNEFMLCQSLNSHEIDSRNYSPIMFMNSQL